MDVVKRYDIYILITIINSIIHVRGLSVTVQYCIRWLIFVIIKHWQAAHSDLERGHGGAPRRRHLFAAAGCPAPRRPLRDRVRKKTIWNLGAKMKDEGGKKDSKLSASLCVVVCQPARGKRHTCEVHLRPVSGGRLEPCLHGHTGTQRLCQGERDGGGKKGKWQI